MQTDFCWQMQLFPCKVSSALMGPPNSLLVPRVKVEKIRTGLPVELSQVDSSRGGCSFCSFSASAELLLWFYFLPWDFIPFPWLGGCSWKGSGSPESQEHSRTGVKLCPSLEDKFYLSVPAEIGINSTKQNNRWESCLNMHPKLLLKWDYINFLFHDHSCQHKHELAAGSGLGWGKVVAAPRAAPGVSLGSGNTAGMFVLEELHCWELSLWSASF